MQLENDLEGEMENSSIELIRVTPVQILAALIPPFGAAAVLERRGIPAHLAAAGGLAPFPAVAYGVFWLAWATMPDQRPAVVAGWVVLVVGIGLFCVAIANGQWRSELVPPFAIAAFATAGLLLWTYHGYSDYSVLHLPAVRWTHELPSDNAIPFFFAQGLFAGKIPSPLVSGWLPSDRPPLQTALYLMTPDSLLRGPRDAGYQAAAVSMQMIALVGSWALMRALGVGRICSLVGTVAIFFTPLVLVNGSFVWPKLLPAGLLLALAVIHLTEAYFTVRHSVLWGLAVGALAALAMLAHGGSIFALVGIGIAALTLGRFGSRRYTISAGAIFIALYVPWIAYQHFVDPPGDGLLKMHIAGVSHEDRGPLLPAIIKSYSSLTLSEIVTARMENFLTLFEGLGLTYSGTIKAVKFYIKNKSQQTSDLLRHVRDTEFFYFVAGNGLLGIGFFFLPISWFDVKIRPLAWAVSIGLLFWCLVMFEGRATLIHQGSLFPELAVMVGIIAVTSRRPWIAYPLLVLHIGVTAFQYAM